MEKAELSQLVAAAKKKNSKAIEGLYIKTNHIAYYTALRILKNDADAQDAVQDSYINVFAKLQEIQDNAFVSYLKIAVANTCKNSLKRKNPILFSSNAEELNTFENIEEVNENFLPESYISNNVKREQVLSIVNNLSDVQRTAILLFYFDEMSISEIAKVMECSESTIQSRIAYAKMHIKNEVEKLEQQGDKLYGKAFIPVPFLRKLFSEDSKNHKLPEATAKAIFHNVISSAVADSTGMGGFMASGLFAKFAGLTTLTKAAIAAAGAAVIVGCSVAGIAATGHLNNNQVKTAAAAGSSEVTVSSASSQIASSKESSSSMITSSQSVVSSAISSAAVSTASSKAATAQKTPAKPAPPKSTGVAPTKKPSGGTTGGTTGGTPQPTSPTGAVAGNDGVANAKWLVSNLGFQQGENPQGAYYNPDNAAASLALITVSHVDGCNYMIFRQWGGSVDSVSKGLLRFYLPNSYVKLYNMLNAFNDGSDAYTGKHYNMDGRDVVFYWYESSAKLQLEISDK